VADTHDKLLAVFYDGTSSRKHRVELKPAERLEIIEDGVMIDAWPFDHIRLADGAMALRLTSISAAALARLDIDDKATAERVAAFLPRLEELKEKHQTGRIVGWSLAAAASITLIVLYGLPLLAERLTPLVPVAMEQRIGEAVDSQLLAITGAEICTGEAGQRALEKLIGKISRQSGRKVDARVLSMDIANAVALPGNKVYLFKGMLEKANSADEVAGVMAHEIGHAHNRDVLRTLIQQGSTSFLLGLLLGDITGSGAVLFAAQTLLDASHSRETETRADDFAIASMTHLGRSAVPMGEFLVRLTGDGKATILDSHPASAERLERIRRLDKPVAGSEILSAEEWRALKAICGAS
jgi:predicted Zn-dependent protease